MHVFRSYVLPVKNIFLRNIAKEKNVAVQRFVLIEVLLSLCEHLEDYDLWVSLF